MNQISHDDEIDLIALIQTLWEGKWKIISTTFIAAIMGVAFSLVISSSFKVFTPIQNGKSSVFVGYTSLNDVLKANELPLLVDSENVFQLFVFEFNDYEEMISVLQTNEFVTRSIKKLNDKDRDLALIEYAKSFTIAPPSKNETNWMLSFEWHDVEEGSNLLNEALNITLENVKASIFNDIAKLADAVDLRNQHELEVLHTTLDFLEKRNLLATEKRILYLTEQSAIARELGVETNRLDSSDLTQSQPSSLSLNISSYEIPYYLRGFKAIDKEIALIRSRSKEQQLIMADQYVEIKGKIYSLENDLSSKHLRNSLITLESDTPDDWVAFDLTLADNVSQRNSILYVALSTVLGGMMGVMYVLMSNAIHKRREQLPET